MGCRGVGLRRVLVAAYHCVASGEGDSHPVPVPHWPYKAAGHGA